MTAPPPLRFLRPNDYRIVGSAAFSPGSGSDHPNAAADLARLPDLDVNGPPPRDFPMDRRAVRVLRGGVRRGARRRHRTGCRGVGLKECCSSRRSSVLASRGRGGTPRLAAATFARAPATALPSVWSSAPLRIRDVGVVDGESRPEPARTSVLFLACTMYACVASCSRRSGVLASPSVSAALAAA